LTWLTLEGEAPAAIALELGCKEYTVRKMQRELGLVKTQVKRIWTAAERRLVRKLYPDTSPAKIAKKLSCKISQLYQLAARMGVGKSTEYLAKQNARLGARLQKSGFGHRYPKGHIPANKGLRRPGYAPGRMAATQFKPGARSGFAEKNWKPIGTIATDNEGFQRIKIRDRVNGKPIGWDKSIWPLLHHREWEKHHGPIPPGHKVVFKDGDRSHSAIENLELLTDGEMMLRNTIHKLPTELKDTIVLLSRVRRRMKKCQKTQ